MTKLYHGPEGHGWQVPGQQDRKAERADVPNAPAELAAWLNERGVRPQLASAPTAEPFEGFEDDLELHSQRAAEAEARGPRVPGFCDSCGLSRNGTLKLGLGNDLDGLSAWLETVDVGNLWALERAAERIRDRARELGAEWAGRTVQ